MTRIEIDGDRATLFGPIPFLLIQQIARCSGRKKWNGQKSVSIEASGSNMRILKSSGIKLAIKDKTNDRERLTKTPTKERPKYRPKQALKPYQKEAVLKAQKQKTFAFFMDPGMGKTATALTDIGLQYMRGEIAGVLIVAPEGVHEQWCRDEIPKHMDASIAVNAMVWERNCKSEDDVKIKKGLNILSINIEAMRSARGFPTCQAFIDGCQGRVMMIVDESHRIADPSTTQSKTAEVLGKMCSHRRILTGTPMRKTATDIFGQFKFLDWKIIGHKYVTSFKAEFCIMGGYENRQVIGHKNLPELFAMIEPYCYRATKEEHLKDLPKKTYAKHEYKPSAKTMKHYKELKKELITQLDDGTITTAANAVSAMIRMQQIVCGYSVDEEGNQRDVSSERIGELLSCVRRTNGQAIIWARFTRDVETIAARLDREYGKGSCRTYYGSTPKKLRAGIRDDFKSGKFRFLVGNAAAGGTGLDLPDTARTVIYYSNDYSSVSRWQSEDRTHRVNSTFAPLYIDMVAKGTHDAAILSNIAKKRQLLDAFMRKHQLSEADAIEAFARSGGDKITLRDVRDWLA